MIPKANCGNHFVNSHLKLLMKASSNEKVNQSYNVLLKHENKFLCSRVLQRIMYCITRCLLSNRLQRKWNEWLFFVSS